MKRMVRADDPIERGDFKKVAKTLAAHPLRIGQNPARPILRRTVERIGLPAFDGAQSRMGDNIARELVARHAADDARHPALKLFHLKSVRQDRRQLGWIQPLEHAACTRFGFCRF